MNRLLTAERDALKLAVKEGEAEVGRLRRENDRFVSGGNGWVKRAMPLQAELEFANQQIDRLRRRVALIQGFFSDDKDQFRESLRAILQEREQEDGDEK